TWCGARSRPCARAARSCAWRPRGTRSGTGEFVVLNSSDGWNRSCCPVVPAHERTRICDPPVTVAQCGVASVQRARRWMMLRSRWRWVAVAVAALVLPGCGDATRTRVALNERAQRDAAPQSPAAMSAEQAEQLKALGYMGQAAAPTLVQASAKAAAS